MSKQLSRSYITPSNAPDYYLINYNLVFPKVPVKVNYRKEIRAIINKSKRKFPLIEFESFGKSYTTFCSYLIVFYGFCFYYLEVAVLYCGYLLSLLLIPILLQSLSDC